MEILAGCECSGVVRDAFINAGHNAMSCDLQPTSRPGPHYCGDVFDVIDYPWDIAIFHPPCTHTAVSGAKHFIQKRLDGRCQSGAAFFLALVRRSAHIPATVFEQPVSVMSSLYRKPDQIIHPWMFGHYETKATCLWLRGLPLLVPTYKTPEECRIALALPAGPPADRIHKMAPSPTRAQERSATYPGIAQAFAAQWGAVKQRIAA